MGVSAPSPLRVGLLGYGLAGSVFHAPLIAATGGLRLDAVVTANPQRQALVLRDYPHARVFDRAEQLLASGSLDLVVVATPNRSTSHWLGSRCSRGCPSLSTSRWQQRLPRAASWSKKPGGGPLH